MNTGIPKAAPSLLAIFICAAVALLPCSRAGAMARAPKHPEPKSSPAAATPPPVAASPEASPTPPAINQKAQVAVLGYHRIVEKVRRPDTEITAADFEAQMQQLKDSGVTVIPLQDLLAWKRGEKDIPAMSVVITMDDGWKSQYETAWPILKKFGYPFTLFIYTDYVKGGPKSGGESMSWEQLAEMRDAGADIEGHTVSHHDLRGKKGKVQSPQYEGWLWNELNGSKELLEQRLAIKVRALALPYGYYNHHVQEVAKKAGYEAIFTVNGQKITNGTPPQLLGRFMIEANKPKIFASALQFDSGGGNPTAPVHVAEAKSMAAEPADGSTIQDAKPTLKVSLKSFGKVDPKTIVMRVSGIGTVDAKYDPASQMLSYQPSRKLTENNYTVIVSAMAQGGRKEETRWSFTIGPAAVAAPPAGKGKDASPVPAASAKPAAQKTGAQPGAVR